jgi:hypothetical protein
VPVMLEPLAQVITIAARDHDRDRATTIAIT